MREKETERENASKGGRERECVLKSVCGYGRACVCLYVRVGLCVGLCVRLCVKCV